MHHEVLNTRIALGNFTQSNSANAKSSAALRSAPFRAVDEDKSVAAFADRIAFERRS